MTILKQTKFNVYGKDGSILIPKGTKNVKCRFCASHLVRNTDNGLIYPVQFDHDLEKNEKRLNQYQLPHSTKWIHA